MRTFIISIAILLLKALTVSAQLPIVYLPPNASVHFRSPEPVQYVDISSCSIAGDIPLKNVVRLKYIPDSLSKDKAGFPKNAVVTIAGESFLAQYLIVYMPNPETQTQTNIEILPEHTTPVDIGGISLSQHKLKDYALQFIGDKPKGHFAKSKAFGLEGRVSQIATLGDYIFLDVSWANRTNLKYDIDEIRFKIRDKKVNKASNVQEVEIRPEFSLYKSPGFQKHYRNVFVFKKFSFPGNKMLDIEMTEKQISGRYITLSLKYAAILNADTM
ncbi:DUF4138 domain-containing protein [Pedobacter hiemivivus]|uniref:DUF4138 domain-containing protein n=1 Tax=Pedobacter hiemivivus TaxID=2530454 RepID=A0A4V6N5Z0_9SPHI|nr:DUF4138 domain-containing protein [Pedobacter hiemivivus]TCC98776.1 DUF4138 domain-containing protein [Pedobacter hiemivivus]